MFLSQSYSDITGVVTRIECTHIRYNVILFEICFKAIHVILTCAQSWHTTTLRIMVHPVTTYVHMLCIVLYYTTCDLNTSLLSYIKVLCERCHHVQLAGHCAVTGKCS